MGDLEDILTEQEMRLLRAGVKRELRQVHYRRRGERTPPHIKTMAEQDEPVLDGLLSRLNRGLRQARGRS